MIRDIRHKIGVAAFRFAHHAIFVIAKICGLQPQRAVFFVSVPLRNHLLYRRFHFAFTVERGFQIEHIKAHIKCLQIQILFAAQIRYRELTNRISIVRIFCTDHMLVVRINFFTGQVGFRHISDVIAAITIRWPRGIIRR